MARDDQPLNPIGLDIDIEGACLVDFMDSIGETGFVARVFLQIDDPGSARLLIAIEYKQQSGLEFVLR